MDTTPGQPFTLALGFGADATAAAGVARASASTPFVSMMDSYVSGWRAYDRALRRPPASVPSSTGARYWTYRSVFARVYRSHIRPAADFVVNHGPAYGVERWEEHPGYSPSTLTAGIAGLVAASQLAAAGDSVITAAVARGARATGWAQATVKG